MQGFLNSEEMRSALFGKDHQILHPMHEDIGRCLAALLPAKIGQFLHELSDNREAFGLSICALFEISPKDINKECIDLITHLFGVPKNRESFFNLAETTVGHPEHPFNASFWSERFSALSMSERDLSWTEYVRYNRYSFEEKLTRFEEICQSDQDLSEFSVKRLHLLAEHTMWLLTSTVRPLRDKGTRALYWYGRRFPQEFFDLVIKSFSINDPYVPERMLAATYGIAMALQNDFEDTNFVTQIFPLYARQLYENMFKLNAPHATTHILARDYARRTIDLALIHHPDLLRKNERERITPPFTDGGIREWDESEDRNEGEREKGPAPLHLDFENYTLSRLVKDKGNYDYEHDEYKRVRANIFWRIYDLGYSLESFGKIDDRLIEENYRKYGRSADGRKTDRYGKKYSWIAFYELAGFRQDNGLLPDYYSEERTLEIDIDPSFPVEERRYNLVTEDFLGDRDVSAEEWVAKTSPPDLTQYLKIDNLCEQQGSWVLLNGYLSQKDDQANRDMFAFSRGLIVKSEETEEIVEGLKDLEKIDGHTVPSGLDDHCTYAGEIPWCDTYPESNWEELQIETASLLVPQEQLALLRNGKPASEDDIYELCDNIAGLIGTENFDDISLRYFSDIASIVDLIERDDWETIEAQLHEQGFELTTKTVNVEQKEYRIFKVLVPVRGSNWSDSQSAAVPGRSVEIPSKQITETFDLCGQPQSFDLFEKDGRRASMTFRCGEGWGKMQDFTYLRKDLLENYLKKIDGELIWVIWGEQNVVPPDEDTPYKLFHDVKVYHQL